jgi:predicted XRE-type DNA-binding protein
MKVSSRSTQAESEVVSSRPNPQPVSSSPKNVSLTPDDHFIKTQLVSKIDSILKQRSLKQVEAAQLLGIRQPDVSKLLRGELRRFSVERPLRFLVALNPDVQIVV